MKEFQGFKAIFLFCFDIYSSVNVIEHQLYLNMFILTYLPLCTPTPWVTQFLEVGVYF